MASFEKTACKPKELLSMTGYTLNEFNALLPSFEEAILESNQTLEGKKRVNKPAAYKNSAFSNIADQLFFHSDLYEAVHNSNYAWTIVWNIPIESKFMDSLPHANFINCFGQNESSALS